MMDRLEVEDAPEPSSPAISIVVPVYRSEHTVGRLHDRIRRTMVQAGLGYEIIFVEDRSMDGSWIACRDLARSEPSVRAIRMRRNSGQHNAVLCGVRAARGRTVVTLDDDLQNPPEEIPNLLDRLDDDVDVVYGTPIRQETKPWRRVASRGTKVALARVGGFPAATFVSPFRAFRTELRDSFETHRSPHVNVDVLLSWATDRFVSLPVRHDRREHGDSGYSTYRLIRHAANMITGFSSVPLKVASILGFGSSLLGIVLLAYVLIRFLVAGQAVPGFAFLASSIAIFSGVQLFTIGIIGEYLGRLYFGSMGRPGYSVAEIVAGPPLAVTDVARVPVANGSGRRSSDTTVAPDLELRLGGS